MKLNKFLEKQRRKKIDNYTNGLYFDEFTLCADEWVYIFIFKECWKLNYGYDLDDETKYFKYEDYN